jgi:hypothetical protein
MLWKFDKKTKNLNISIATILTIITQDWNTLEIELLIPLGKMLYQGSGDNFFGGKPTKN